MKRFSKFGVLLSIFSVAIAAATAEPLEPGEKVPSVPAVDSENKAFDVTAHLKQGMTLVFFFPKANTGG
ncbi:MAG: hypothetical protein ACI9R3_002301 [Verrucomicrobiales bacterium]|jgi:hypothetical protein